MRFLERCFTLGLTGSIALTGCAPQILVGYDDRDAGPNSRPDASLDAAVDAGADADVIVGAPWSANQETGDTSEWQGPLAASLVDGAGKLVVTRTQAHSGSYALEATIAPVNDTLEQAMIGREVTLRSGKYSAWYYVPRTIATDYWVLMKLSSQPDGNRFDIDVQTVTGDVPRLRLYEHGHDYITPASSIPLPIATWFQLEVSLIATPKDIGRLSVKQDGVTVLDTGPRATMSDDRVIFLLGSASHYVSPAPFSVFIDDAVIAIDGMGDAG
jgi:hypothetical protein